MLYCIVSDWVSPKLCKNKCKCKRKTLGQAPSECIASEWGAKKYVNVNVKNQYVNAVV